MNSTNSKSTRKPTTLNQKENTSWKLSASLIRSSLKKTGTKRSTMWRNTISTPSSWVTTGKVNSTFWSLTATSFTCQERQVFQLPRLKKTWNNKKAPISLKFWKKLEFYFIYSKPATSFLISSRTWRKTTIFCSGVPCACAGSIKGQWRLFVWGGKAGQRSRASPHKVTTRSADFK